MKVIGRMVVAAVVFVVMCCTLLAAAAPVNASKWTATVSGHASGPISFEAHGAVFSRVNGTSGVGVSATTGAALWWVHDLYGPSNIAAYRAFPFSCADGAYLCALFSPSVGVTGAPVVRALDPATGRIVWEKADELLAVNANYLFGYNPPTRHLKRYRTTDGVSVHLGHHLEESTHPAVGAVTLNGTVLFGYSARDPKHGNHKHTVRAYGVDSSGEKVDLWKHTVSHRPTQMELGDSGRSVVVHYGAVDRNVVAYSTATGSTLWTSNNADGLQHYVGSMGELSVYATTDATNVSCVNTVTGDTLWWQPWVSVPFNFFQGDYVSFTADRHMVVYRAGTKLSLNSSVYLTVFALDSGTVVFREAVPLTRSGDLGGSGPLYTSATTPPRLMYFGTDTVYVVELSGAPRTTAFAVRGQSPRAVRFASSGTQVIVSGGVDGHDGQGWLELLQI